MESEACVVMCTVPSAKIATELAHQIIESKLAACVNILPGLTSVYSWQNKTETAQEVLLFIKTTTKAYQTLETILVNAHPYECPEIIGVPIKHGLKGYLHWIQNSVLTTA